jgi:hypothetical protein
MALVKAIKLNEQQRVHKAQTRNFQIRARVPDAKFYKKKKRTYSLYDTRLSQGGEDVDDGPLRIEAPLCELKVHTNVSEKPTYLPT